MHAFSRYNLTASKFTFFLAFFNNVCSNAFCGHRQPFGRSSSSELLIIKFSSLRFSSCFSFLLWYRFECVIHARAKERKRNHALCVTLRKSSVQQGKFGLFFSCFSLGLFHVAALLAISLVALSQHLGGVAIELRVRKKIQK